MHEKFRGLDRGVPTRSLNLKLSVHFSSHHIDGIAVFGKGSNNNLLVPNVIGAVHTPKYAVHRLAPSVEGCNKRNVNDGDERHKPASYHGQREPLKDSFDHVGTIPP